MKEMNEYKAEIFSRMEKGIKERKRKRNRILAYATPMCLCLVILLSFSIWQGGLFKQPISNIDDNSTGTGKGNETYYTGALPVDDEKDGQYDDEKDGVWGYHDDKSNKNNNPGTQDNSNDRLLGVIVNKISDTVTGAKLYYDPDLYDERTLTEKEAIEYLGLDFSNLKFNAKYQGIGMKNIITDKLGKIAYDTFAISFGDNITILTSKKGLPYDCLYELESNDETVITTVNNESASQTTAIVGTDNDGFYYADFSAGNINYRVKMENCNKLSEFYTVVKAVIELSIK